MAVDRILLAWFALTALSVLFITWDLVFRTPEMKVMKAGWILVALYLGPIAFVVYWLSCREPSPGTHEQFVAPLWKQTVGSTIHCLAGDATGVIASAAFVNRMRLPMAVDSAVEYVIGFAFGLFIFQALFMRDMLGGSYGKAVRATILPEWLSMNAVMAGMVPVMTILMSRDMRAMEATSMRFWGVMSLATLAGAVLAMPINWWLVSKKLKHGMGTERALGKGGAAARGDMMHAGHAKTPEAMPAPNVSMRQKVAVSAVTVVMLFAGVIVAARAGAFARPSHRGMKNVKYALSDIEVHRAGDTAWATFKYSISADVKDRHVDGAGIGTAVLEKRGGDWKIVHWHSSSPRKPAAPVQKPTS